MVVAVLLPRLVGHQRHAASCSALHSVVAHSRLDAEVDFEDEAELIAVAEALDTDQPVP